MPILWTNSFLNCRQKCNFLLSIRFCYLLFLRKYAKIVDGYCSMEMKTPLRRVDLLRGVVVTYLGLSLGLEVGILTAGEVAGAVLGYMGKFAMAYDAGLRVLLCQLLQQLVEGVLLSFSAGVVSLAFLVQSALVHNTERAVIVMSGVYTLHSLW